MVEVEATGALEVVEVEDVRLEVSLVVGEDDCKDDVEELPDGKVVFVLVLGEAGLELRT